MTIILTDSDTERWVLVECPSSRDAGFAGQWLLAATSADRLLQCYYVMDPNFRERIFGLETMYCIEFEPAAMAFLRKWLKTRCAFSLSLYSQWADMFSIMAAVGFFTRTGDRYQLTLPKNLRIIRIKDALLQLADTEDAELLHHPSRFLCTMSKDQAKSGKYVLGQLNQQQRVANRNALIAD